MASFKMSRNHHDISDAECGVKFKQSFAASMSSSMNEMFYNHFLNHKPIGSTYSMCGWLEEWRA